MVFNANSRDLIFPLKEIAEVKGGKRLPKGDFLLEEKTEHPYIRVSDFNDFGTVDTNSLKFISESTHEKIARYTISKDDLYISIAGTIGKTGIIPLELDGANLTENAAKIVFKDKGKQLIKYVYYFTKTHDFIDQIGLATKTVAQPKLALTRLSNVLIPIPPLSEQKRIVEKLDVLLPRIDTAIEHLQQSVELADAFLRSTLSYELKKKGHWKLVKLDGVCNITAKLCDPKEPEYIDTLHVGGANIDSFSGSLMDLKTAREEKLISGKYPFSNEMVLYSKIRPYLMKVARPNFSGICSADIYPLTPNKDLLHRDFLFYLLLSEDFTNYAVQGSSRAGMPKVNRKHLFEYKFFLPPLAEQQSICKTIDDINKLNQMLKKEIGEKLKVLSSLKSSILDSAFKGEL